MSLTNFVAIALLAYIAYQLYQLNEAKRRQEKRHERNELYEQIALVMPHLFKKGINEEQRMELESFYHANSHYWEHTVLNPSLMSDEVVGYSPAEKNLKLMGLAIKNEDNVDRREKMENSLERVRENCKKMMNKIN